MVCEKAFTHPTSLKNHLAKTHSKATLEERGVNVSVLEKKVQKKKPLEELEEEVKEPGLDRNIRDLVKRLQRRLPVLLLLMNEEAETLVYGNKPEVGFAQYDTKGKKS